MSIVRLVERRGAMLVVEDLDVLDGTPLLDVKPYYARFDARPGARSGWVDTVDEQALRERGARGGRACRVPGEGRAQDPTAPAGDEE